MVCPLQKTTGNSITIGWKAIPGVELRIAY